MNGFELPEFLTLISETEKMIKYRDEEIKTTWMISLSANRYYRKVDHLWATQDIKFDGNLETKEIFDNMVAKAAKYRKRVIKANGWKVRSCYTTIQYDLDGIKNFLKD